MILAVGAIIGLVLGLTGAGGSLLAIPLLVYGVGEPYRIAVGLSLLTVLAGALWGAVHSYRENLVAVAPAVVFALGGMLAAPVGYRLTHILPEKPLMASFLILMAIIALRMLHQAKRTPDQTRQVRARLTSKTDVQPICRFSQGRTTLNCRIALVIAGLLTGLLSGLFGVGGGFLIVPILMGISDLPIERAIATSLAVIAAISLSGSLSFLAHTSLDDYGRVILMLMAGALAGMTLGRLLAARLAGPRLHTLFASALIALDLFMGLRLLN
ncbi:MAG: sulfite exporter TauE/SafE family protein [Gammaproteobacteria bacterium]|nr:MAG: sulfite exporter TauE/SafE family protein [Gammaproteobacteria bacterium]